MTPGPEVLDEDVGASRQPPERVAAPAGVFRSSTMPRLPRLTALKLGLSVPTRAGHAPRRIALRRLDLDHVGAHVA